MTHSPQLNLWIITEDDEPMPWENNAWPFRVVVGSESFVKGMVDGLNAASTGALYEYTECTEQRIVFEEP